MIFSDKETADEFRNIAMEQFRQDIKEAIEYGAKYHQYLNDTEDDERRDQLVDSVVQHMEETRGNRLYQTLILRSGIVFCSTAGDSVHDMILYYDNDNDSPNDDHIAQAMQQNNRSMFGGIDKRTGQIHT